METIVNRFIKKAGYLGLFEAYSRDGEEYSGTINDDFEQKFVLFLERCDQSDVADDDRAQGFLIVLTKVACLYFLGVLRPK